MQPPQTATWKCTKCRKEGDGVLVEGGFLWEEILHFQNALCTGRLVPRAAFVYASLRLPVVPEEETELVALTG
jgi:hypothetical protein